MVFITRCIWGKRISDGRLWKWGGGGAFVVQRKAFVYGYVDFDFVFGFKGAVGLLYIILVGIFGGVFSVNFY